ncbi:hypothetical protein [Glaciecola sp. 33A]|jgi:hypothetical protein|uniref:hypothetical protein n=1 Tax=Glaciecola sp. 33A TaxID=2057807 RepID=UPI000C331E71|nr:hypothetical protein [Glaciecola sp. 33A]PKI02376.1 hypothetical protein CXF81_06870 [Glaciecola sp. 33A]
MQKTLALSCWFGDKFKKPKRVRNIKEFILLVKFVIKNLIPISLYSLFKIDSVVPRAPKNCSKSIFFTNNASLKSDILYKGWTYYFINDDVSGIDSISSSLAAKKIKFLVLPDDVERQLNDFDFILYMDSRRITDDIEKLIELCEKGIVIRHTLRFKESVWDEVEEAKEQERYMIGMDDTINFINDHISRGLSASNRVVNTGVILYNIGSIKFRDEIRSLCSEVYNACLDLKQPECQIIWFMLSQRYSHAITTIECNDISTRDN